MFDQQRSEVGGACPERLPAQLLDLAAGERLGLTGGSHEDRRLHQRVGLVRGRRRPVAELGEVDGVEAQPDLLRGLADRAVDR